MMTKNKLWIIAILATFCLGTNAQGVDKLFGEFASSGGESVNLGRFAMTLAGIFSDTHGVNGVEVISLERAGEDVKIRFAEAVRNLSDNRFEHLLDAKENGALTRILARVDGDVINDLVILTSGNKASMVRLKGKIKLSDIEGIVNENRR
ncbi:MAG: DUF4252 domain-containing protein [Tannerellaceae bacterium]|nr:DUF4252 domain-containing protein [Tannerellaceae bacterium]